jgi:hypothetical protein
MKKEALSQVDTLLNASVPTIIFITIFVGVTLWVFLRKSDPYTHLQNLPLDD